MTPSSPHPEVSAYPMSGIDRDGKYILGVIAKRRYIAVQSGECVPAREQSHLNFEPIFDPDHPELILADTDLWLDKPMTDVVVRGHAWNHARRPSFAAALRVGRHPVKQLVVHGERTCRLSKMGRIEFSHPTTVDRVPLTYAFAYGGVDRAAEARIGFPELELAPSLPPEQREAAMAALNPFRYPRNPTGLGFLVDDTPAALDMLKLPQLEDPDDMLTPERLVVSDPWHWPLQPIPASLDWLPHTFFPRVGWFGHTPDWDSEDIGHHFLQFPEIRLGHATREIFELTDDLNVRFDRLALQGASLGLRLGPLMGDERVTLKNLHIEIPTWTLHLPGERPHLAIDDRAGGLTKLRPRLHSIIIEPDVWQVSMVWVGITAARRPYLIDELAKMPFLAEW